MSGVTLERLEDEVTAMLVEMGLPPEPHGDGLYLYRFGDTVVAVSLFEADGEAWVRFASTLLKDFRPNLELVTRVLRLNTEALLGAFLLFEDDTLSFSATLPGSGLASESFRRTMEYVARVSNAHAEELGAIAGGRTPSSFLPA